MVTGVLRFADVTAMVKRSWDPPAVISMFAGPVSGSSMGCCPSNSSMCFVSFILSVICPLMAGSIPKRATFHLIRLLSFTLGSSVGSSSPFTRLKCGFHRKLSDGSAKMLAPRCFDSSSSLLWGWSIFHLRMSCCGSVLNSPSFPSSDRNLMRSMNSSSLRFAVSPAGIIETGLMLTVLMSFLAIRICFPEKSLRMTSSRPSLMSPPV